MNKGKLIFIEGPKGVGKTRALSSLNNPEHPLFDCNTSGEPWNHEIGWIASGQLTDISDPTTQAMLYTADRRVHMRWITEWLSSDPVICDRGPLSTMVYQGLVGGVDLDWLLELNGVAMEGIKVDATILLYAPFETTIERIKARDKSMTQLEEDQLRAAWEAYESLRLGAHDANGHLKHFVEKWKDLTGWIHFIDADRPVDQVEADVMSTIDRILNNQDSNE